MPAKRAWLRPRATRGDRTMRLRSLLGFIAALLLSLGESVTAHPLGNFSISQYSALRVGQREVELRYIIDMAEIPTFQEVQEFGLVPKAGDASVRSYALSKAESLRAGLSLEIDSRPVALRTESHEIIFSDGAGGLPTLKIGMVYRGTFAADSGAAYSLNYRDGNFPGRTGWKEIIAVAAPGVRLLDSSVPDGDRSAELSDYPTDLLDSPPQQLAARVGFTVASVPIAAENSTAAPNSVMAKTQTATTKKSEANRPARPFSPPLPDAQANTELSQQSATAENPVQLKANSQATPRDSFTEIMAKKELGWGIIFFALAVAVGLGAFHALEPGHGKTLVAAYLVGSRGTFKHAFLLGLIVTAAHTAGVYLIGVITLYASKYIVPEKLYPWLG
ncbi:MAG: hypothetical protein FJ143_10030, partial [Deltaproteobacteria bacterium]|nr:hypothetical protein [Deltaproteobacteria bacterium]